MTQTRYACKTPNANTKHKIYSYAGNQLVAVHARSTSGGANTRYPLQDHFGSTVLLTDEQGREVAGSRISYDSWGRARPTSGPNAYRTPALGQSLATIPGRPLGYTGHLNMDDSGLVHMGGRLYDPELGRMASADPNVQFPLSSQGFNRYSYVNNNPLSYTDPSGYFSVGSVLYIAEQLDVARGIKYTLFRQMSSEMAGVVITIGSVFCGPWAPACAAGGTYDYARANGVESEQALLAAAGAAVMTYAAGAANDMAAAGNYGGAVATAYAGGYSSIHLAGGDGPLGGRIALLQFGLKVGMDKYARSHNPATPDYASTLDPAQSDAVGKAQGTGVQGAQASNTGKAIVAPTDRSDAGKLIGRRLSDLSQSDLALLKPYNSQIIELNGHLAFGWQSEGSMFMQSMGRHVGGVNAFSIFHDVWMEHWGVTGGFFLGATIPIAAYMQYQALGAWSQNFILKTQDKQ